MGLAIFTFNTKIIQIVNKILSLLKLFNSIRKEIIEIDPILGRFAEKF